MSHQLIFQLSASLSAIRKCKQLAHDYESSKELSSFYNIKSIDPTERRRKPNNVYDFWRSTEVPINI